MIVCPYCGSTKPLIEVHGHRQCQDCKTNVEPCCSGETDGCPYADPDQEAARQQSNRPTC